MMAGSSSTAASCAGANWLFVISSGGRTGSTTLYSMLNTVPLIHLSGENDHLVYKLHKLHKDSLAAFGHADRGEGQSWYNQADPIGLHNALCAWVASLVPPRPGVVIRGFKEVIQLSHASRRGTGGGTASVGGHFVRALGDAFPRARFIHSFRSPDPQLRSQRATFGFLPSAKMALPSAELLENRTRAVGQLLRETGRPVFDFSLEDFSTQRFNKLLSWLNVRGCHFTRVMHQNANYSFSNKTTFADTRSSSLAGACVFDASTPW